MTCTRCNGIDRQLREHDAKIVALICSDDGEKVCKLPVCALCRDEAAELIKWEKVGAPGAMWVESFDINDDIVLHHATCKNQRR